MVRGLVVVGMGVALAACADAGRAPTATSVAALDFSARGVVTISRGGGAVAGNGTGVQTSVTGARATAVLPGSLSAHAPPGVALSRARDRASGNGSGATLPFIAVRDEARGLMAPREGYRRVLTLRDDHGVTHHLVALYDRSGGPPRVIQHYVGSTLVHLTAMRWRRVNGAWVQHHVLARELRDGALTLEADAEASDVQVAALRSTEGSVGRFASRRIVALLAAGIAHTFAPRDAEAQLYMSECWDKYKEYWKATAALTSAILAIEVGMETGVGAAATNALYFAYTAALAWAAAAEIELFLCVDNASERATPIRPSGPEGGPGGGMGARGPSGDECLNGSYAARCQTPYGL
jgi:hypothetical protein